MNRKNPFTQLSIFPVEPYQSHGHLALRTVSTTTQLHLVYKPVYPSCPHMEFQLLSGRCSPYLPSNKPLCSALLPEALPSPSSTRFTTQTGGFIVNIRNNRLRHSIQVSSLTYSMPLHGQSHPLTLDHCRLTLLLGRVLTATLL